MGLIICYGILGILLFFLGACVFSFLNVVIYRVPKKKSFVKGFSFCPACGHRLGFPDMIPIVSYLVLGGKCRYCKSKIGSRDTWIEGFGGLLAIFCVWRYGAQSIWAAVTVFAFLGMLTVVAFMDLDTMEIADGCHLAILVTAVAACFTMPEISLVDRLIGLVVVSVPMLLLAMAVPGGFGGGDIKLMGAAGCFLGWKLTIVGALLGILGGGIYGIYLLAAKKKGKKEQFAFGPFLCLGMAIALFWGMQLWNWYMGLLSFS